MVMRSFPSVRVFKMVGNRPLSKWVPWRESPHGDYNYTEIAPSQIISDIEYQLPVKELKRALEALDRRALIWATGGRGIHIEECCSELAKLPGSRRVLVKEAAVEELATAIGLKEEIVDLTACRDNRILGTPLTPHRKTRKLKRLLAVVGEPWAESPIKRQWVGAALRKPWPSQHRKGWSK